MTWYEPEDPFEEWGQQRQPTLVDAGFVVEDARNGSRGRDRQERRCAVPGSPAEPAATRREDGSAYPLAISVRG